MATGMIITATAMSTIALLLFVMMAAWKRPSAMQSAAHALVILSGLLQVICAGVHAAIVSGDLGLGNAVSQCGVQPAPMVMLAGAAVLLWISSCALCTCCACDCNDDLNTSSGNAYQLQEY